MRTWGGTQLQTLALSLPDGVDWDDPVESGHFGLRVLPARKTPYRAGDFITRSHRWVDGDCDWFQWLPGSSALRVADLRCADPEALPWVAYTGQAVALVKGHPVPGYGEDMGEVVLAQARIIAILQDA